MTAAAPPVSLGGGRLRYLDGYRGVAALAVLAFHVSGRSQWFSNPGVFGLDGGAWMERLGNFAVCVFFLLSGLVLYRPFAAAHLDGTPQPRVGAYLRRRFLRIFPAYVVALTAFYGLGLLTELRTPMRPSEYVWQYLLLQNYASRGFAASLPVAWTLCIEIAFYVALPLIALSIRHLPGGTAGSRSDRMHVQLVGLGLLAGLGWTYRIALLAGRPQWTGSPPNWLPGFLDWFALGMLLAVCHAWRSGGGALPRWLTNLADTPWLCWIFAAQLYWLTVQLHIPTNFMDDGPKTLARFALNGPAAFMLLLPAVLGRRETPALRALESPVCAFLGTISYGIYLWHVIVIRWTGRLHLELVFTTRLLLTTALTLVLAFASYRLVELPAMRSLRRGRRARAPEPRLAPSALATR